MNYLTIVNQGKEKADLQSCLQYFAGRGLRDEAAETGSSMDPQR